MISRYTGISPKGDLLFLQKLGERLEGRSFLHINSTKSGGGVAEILQRMIPMLVELGIDARWDVIEGDDRFFDITKKLHNSLQGHPEVVTKQMWEYHREVNTRNLKRLDLEADAVLIHDPQPVPLIEFKKGGIWMWRCHIDLSSPYPGIFDYLRQYCVKYDAAIFSVAKFVRSLGIEEFIIPPSIDPLSDKNRDLTDEEIQKTREKFGLPADRPIVLQISRFDRFKDPIGVIQAYRIVKKYNDCVLVLAGSPATDDPEGEAVMREVEEFAAGDPDIHLLMLPPFSDGDVNALQRMATVVLQKSLREGFGLTVSEAMWKGKPVIGGAVGGIPLQIVHGVTGFLVHSVEGTAFRIRQFLNYPEMTQRMGEMGKEYVRSHFLITRQMMDYLTIWYSRLHSDKNLLEL